MLWLFMYIGVIYVRKEKGEPSSFDEPLLKEIAERIFKIMCILVSGRKNLLQPIV